ncbi:MAG TPA: signal peptidase I [Bryobacteraceae bacterium]|jgi:signal peptidase I
MSRASNAVRGFVNEWTINILILLFGTTTLVQAFIVPTGSMETTVRVGDHLLVDKLSYSNAGPISKYFLPYTPIKRGDVIVFRYPLDISQNYVKRVMGVPGDHLRLHAWTDPDGHIHKDVFLNGKQLTEPYIQHVRPGMPLSIESYPDNFPSGPPTVPEMASQADSEVESARLDLQRAQEAHLDTRSAAAEVNLAAAQRKQAALNFLAQNIVNGEVVVPEGYYWAMGDNRDNSADSRYWGFVPRDNIIGKPLLIFWSYDADTADLVDFTADHFIDLARNFFSKTRWDRELKLIRGYPVGQ